MSIHLGGSFDCDFTHLHYVVFFFHHVSVNKNSWYPELYTKP
jgi:hypothetical protein